MGCRNWMLMSCCRRWRRFISTRWSIRTTWWWRRSRRSICRRGKDPNAGLTERKWATQKSPTLSQRTRKDGAARIHAGGLGLYDLLGGWIPDGDVFMEVGEVCQVAADGGVVAEDFVLDYRPSSADGVVEVGLVVDGVAVSGRGGIGLFLVVDFVRQSGGLRMVFVPLLQILVA